MAELQKSTSTIVQKLIALLVMLYNLLKSMAIKAMPEPNPDLTRPGIKLVNGIAYVDLARANVVYVIGAQDKHYPIVATYKNKVWNEQQGTYNHENNSFVTWNKNDDGTVYRFFDDEIKYIDGGHWLE